VPAPAIKIKTYKRDQARGKTIWGGVNGGFLRDAYQSSRKEFLEIKPPITATAIIAIR
jgi:hypothetical protein